MRCGDGTTMKVKVDSTVVVGLSNHIVSSSNRNQTNQSTAPPGVPPPPTPPLPLFYEAFKTDPKNCCASNTSRTVSS